MQWGSTEINHYWGTYRPPYAEAGINEITILAAPGASTPATVLQQNGRSRKRASWEGFTTSLADYNSLQDDKLAATTRTFTGAGGETLSAIIESLSEPEYYDGMINYSLTLVEA